MAKVADALSKRREHDRLVRKAVREDNRRRRAERLETRRQREKAKLEAKAIQLAGSPPLKSDALPIDPGAPAVGGNRAGRGDPPSGAMIYSSPDGAKRYYTGPTSDEGYGRRQTRSPPSG
jgi:hypothetical protein